MAGDESRKAAAYKRVLETFKIQNMRDSQVEALEKLLRGQGVFVIQPFKRSFLLLKIIILRNWKMLFHFYSGRYIKLLNHSVYNRFS